jgi:hypothetical protein
LINIIKMIHRHLLWYHIKQEGKHASLEQKPPH